jgi:hypothetical protein
MAFMYRDTLKQMEFEDFKLPFGGRLKSNNRWVKLAKMIPWDEIEEIYTSSLAGTGMGAPAKSARVALGALIIKEHYGKSDEETVWEIQENPYLQYFLGYETYSDKKPFDPSMFTHFRLRFGLTGTQKVNDIIGCMIKADIGQTSQAKEESGKEQDDDPPENSGKLILDATCAPADITFPTDLKILNDARVKSEAIIDDLHAPLKGTEKKPRSWRKNARRDFLRAAKAKRLSEKKRRKAIRKQLGYLGRNLRSIKELSQKISLACLTRKRYKNLLVIHEVYRQQKIMFEGKLRRMDDRIVSIHQPHIRPIKRGKAGRETEFGAKLSVSLVDGVAFVDHLSWDNFNEGGDLPSQAAVYRKRFGCWPESIHADKVYRNRDNLKFCKERGIRLSGPPLGRPPGEPSANKAIAREDERDRIAIEGKFGQGKRRFNLGLIMSKGSATSACSIVMSFLVMNLMKWLKVIFSVLFFLLSDKMEGFGKASSGTQNRFWNDFILWMNRRLKTLPAS